MEPVRYRVDSGVARLRLFSPKSGNALGPELLEALHRFLQQAEADKDCRALVLSAEGSVFCRGLDLQAITADAGPPDLRWLQVFAECLTLLARSSRPVIGCVEGSAMGGGVGLAAACDLVISTPDAVFSLPEVVLGMVPALVAPFLLRRLSAGRVRYLALSSRGVSAKEAQEWGLVDEIALEGMDRAIDRQLGRILRSSSAAIAETKRLICSLSPDLEAQTDTAIGVAQRWIQRPDVLEALRLFADGMTPPWFSQYRKDAHVAD